MLSSSILYAILLEKCFLNQCCKALTQREKDTYMHIHVEAKCLKCESHVNIFLYSFFAASMLGSLLHLFLALVFTGKRQFVQVFVRWLQRLMRPCYQSSSEITVSGSGKICRHGDKPVSCRLRCGDPRGRVTPFSESHDDVYPLLPVSRGRQTEGKHGFLDITLLHQAEADLYISHKHDTAKHVNFMKCSYCHSIGIERDAC